MKAKVMLIGGEGYIGNIIQSISSKKLEFFSYDINIKNKNSFLDVLDKNKVHNEINKINPDIVINLAARTDLNGRDINDYSVNWEGVQNVIESIKAKNIWFIHFSTMLVCKLGHDLKNEMDYCPDTIYGESKVLSEKIVTNSKCDNWTIIRPTTVWGKKAKFPYSFFISIVRNIGFIELDIFSAKRDFCHEDFAKILIESMLSSFVDKKITFHKKIFYLTDTQPSSINDLARISTKLYGGKTYKLPTFLNRFLNAQLIIFAKLGDILDKVFKIKFIMNTRRLKNMQTQSRLDKNMSKLIETK